MKRISTFQDAINGRVVLDLGDGIKLDVPDYVASLAGNPESKLRGELSATFVSLARDPADSFQTVKRRLNFEDTAAAKGSMLNLEHWGAGTNGTTQTYGADFHNNPGARCGFAGHQYSSNGAFMQLDNTGTAPMISIKNTNNPVRNPDSVAGTSATGDFLSFTDTIGNQMFRVLGRGEILARPAADAAGHGLEIVGAAGSTKRVLKTTMNGPNTGVEMVAAAGSSGFYPLLVTGYDYGPHFTTSQDGASRSVLQLTKNGLGAGIGLQVTNKGTGKSFVARDSLAEVFGVSALGIPQWTAAANAQTTVGAAGAAAALPATPSKYLKVQDSAGTTFVVPAYAAA